MNAMFAAAAPPTPAELFNPRGPEYWYMLSEPPIVCEDVAPDASLSEASNVSMERECNECMEIQAGEQRLQAFVTIVVRSALRRHGTLELSDEELTSIFRTVQEEGYSVEANVHLGGYVDEDFPLDSFYLPPDPTGEDMTERLPNEIVRMHPELFPLRRAIHRAVDHMLWFSPSTPPPLPLATITASQLNIQEEPAGSMIVYDILDLDQENIPPMDRQDQEDIPFVHGNEENVPTVRQDTLPTIHEGQENIPPPANQDQENTLPTNGLNRNILSENHTNDPPNILQIDPTLYLDGELPPTASVNPLDLLAIREVPDQRHIYFGVRRMYMDWRQRNTNLLSQMPPEMLWPDEVFGLS